MGLGLLLLLMLAGGSEARAVPEPVGPPFERGGMEEYVGCYSTVFQPLDSYVHGDCGFRGVADPQTGSGSLEAWSEAAGGGQVPSLGASSGAVTFRDTFEVTHPVEVITVSVEWLIEKAFASHTGFLYREFKPGNAGISGWARFYISSDVEKADCWQCKSGRGQDIIEAVRGGGPMPPIENTTLDQSFQVRRIGGGLLPAGTYDLRLRAFSQAYLNGNYQGVGDTGRVSAGASFRITHVSIDY